MTARRLAILLPLVLFLALAVGARADHESLDAHTAHPPKVIVLDNEHVQPSSLDLGPHDALVFENHSIRPRRSPSPPPSDRGTGTPCGPAPPTGRGKSEAPG